MTRDGRYRRTYRAKLEFLFQMDDEMLAEVRRKVQEHINETYARMGREDIRIVLQTDFGVADLGVVDGLTGMTP